MTDDGLQRRPKRRGRQILRLGETVRIVSGPFVAFTGRIQGINQAKSLLKVKVAIFGRDKALKFNFSDVEKVRFR